MLLARVIWRGCVVGFAAVAPVLGGLVGCAAPVGGGGGNGGGDNVNENTDSTTLRCDPGTTGGAATVSYADDIVPLFNSVGCLSSSCHGGAVAVSGNYDMRTYNSLFEPGESAIILEKCPVVPGQPDSSYWIEKISSDVQRIGVRMPNNSDGINRPPLTQEQIDLIRTWIAEGAQDN